MSRHFRIEEAEGLLPEVERALRDALFQKSEYQEAETGIRKVMQRIRSSGGARVDPGPVLSLRNRRDAAAAGMKESFERVEQLGALIKDLDIGLIDFLTMYEGNEVCLCWKLGEDRIRYWHGTTEGFQGRKEITDDFRKLHRGDTPV